MPASVRSEDTQKEALPVNMNGEAIWQAHRSIDGVYGAGFAKENPLLVARFMTAFALRDLAEAVNRHGSKATVELEALHQILAEGSGAITVGLEKIG